MYTQDVPQEPMREPILRIWRELNKREAQEVSEEAEESQEISEENSVN